MQIIISIVTIVNPTDLNLNRLTFNNVKKFLLEERGSNRNSFEQWKYNKDAIKNFLKISASYFRHCNRSSATFPLSSFNKNSVWKVVISKRYVSTLNDICVSHHDHALIIHSICVHSESWRLAIPWIRLKLISLYCVS